jgi:hypothetical protein
MTNARIPCLNDKSRVSNFPGRKEEVEDRLICVLCQIVDLDSVGSDKGKLRLCPRDPDWLNDMILTV